MFKRIVAVVLVVLGVFLFSCSGEDPATGGVVKSSAKEILSFQLVSPAVAGVITNQTILVTVPYGPTAAVWSR
jgi:type IV secretory pathway protease TraF